MKPSNEIAFSDYQNIKKSISESEGGWISRLINEVINLNASYNSAWKSQIPNTSANAKSQDTGIILYDTIFEIKLFNLCSSVIAYFEGNSCGANKGCIIETILINKVAVDCFLRVNGIERPFNTFERLLLKLMKEINPDLDLANIGSSIRFYTEQFEDISLNYLRAPDLLLSRIYHEPIQAANKDFELRDFFYFFPSHSLHCHELEVAFADYFSMKEMFLSKIDVAKDFKEFVPIIQLALETNKVEIPETPTILVPKNELSKLELLTRLKALQKYYFQQFPYLERYNKEHGIDDTKRISSIEEFNNKLDTAKNFNDLLQIMEDYDEMEMGLNDFFE